MINLARVFKKIYRPIFLPILLLVLTYYLLVVPISGGKMVEFILQPWGLAVVLMIISSIYIEHIFTTPKDALVNSLNALIISIVFWETLRINFWIATIFSLLVFVSGIIFLVAYDQNRKISSLSKFASLSGKAKVIFALIAGLSFFDFFDGTEATFSLSVQYNILYIIVFYLVFIFLTSKNIIDKVKNFPLKFFNYFHFDDLGIIKENFSPNIVLVEFHQRSGIKINDLIFIGENDIDRDNLQFDDEIKNRIGLVIDFIGTRSERDMVTARVYLLNEPQKDLCSDRDGLLKLGQECKKISDPKMIIDKIDSDRIKFAWNRREDIVALVAPLSNINVLKGEIIRNQQLENAQLVSCINKKPDAPIRYQIIDAETHRAEQGIKGYTQFMAYQLGEWRAPKNERNAEISSSFKRFFEFQWVPNINSLIFRWNDPVDSVNEGDDSINKTGHYLLGTIPKTTIPIYLNIKDLVSHHTAILGVTGTGKTTMVFKLLKEVQTNNIFTICIDITGEYKNKLANHEDFFDQSTHDKWNIEIQKIININKDKNKTHVERDTVERASSQQINQAIKSRINALRATNKIVILEIPEISNTHFSLDFTQYAIQAILQYAKDIYIDNLSKDGTDKDNFQCCLILEEAHTLVPENLGVGGDFGASKAVIDKISQIALQGRKYNVGFILISQRTATVKKTVLNQCNTMIAFRAYDETSFTFLSNYFGDEYVREIIHLKNDGDSRYVIVSGKAVVADRPIIVEVKK